MISPMIPTTDVKDIVSEIEPTLARLKQVAEHAWHTSLLRNTADAAKDAAMLLRALTSRLKAAEAENVELRRSLESMAAEMLEDQDRAEKAERERDEAVALLEPFARSLLRVADQRIAALAYDDLRAARDFVNRMKGKADV